MLLKGKSKALSKQRAEKTLDFCDIPPLVYVLDIGEKNSMGEYIRGALSVTPVNTEGDLDYKITPQRGGKFMYVACFEVIEHLMNPRLFFDNLFGITTNDVTVYLSYPSRPKWLWNDYEHFHEYDEKRFNYLLDRTGWMVVDSRSIYLWRWVFGLRPMIRNLLPTTRVYKIVKK